MIRKVLLVVALVVAASAAMGNPAWAQPGGRGQGGPGGQGGRGGFGGGGFGGGGSAMLLGNPEVREMLELTDDQIERLDELQNDMRAKMQEMFQGMQDLSPEERRDAFTKARDKMTKVTEDMEKELDDVLLDHQRDKLTAMQAKTASRFGGVAGLLNNPAMMKKLGISDREVEKLKEKAQELQDEQNAAIEELREKYNDKMIAMLPKDAQDTVRAWMETEVPDLGGRGGRGGQRGGQRGGRGGNGGGNNNPPTRPQDF